MTTFYNHLCGNCSVWLQVSDGAECSACAYLRVDPRFHRRMWGDNQGLANRRWQMRFNRGELPRYECDAGVLWETKWKLQSW